ncbi:MAG: hypothetical protein M1482_11865, partial [Chloroflexi bacterium]|nr:hypothetical protein [Chloroflexota bacterium]
RAHRSIEQDKAFGTKPYGMWSGPDDRRVDMAVFNFSRAILLHEEMSAHGDANKPVWAVEFGWNALPADWQGAPSPWGTDMEPVQSARLTAAIERARSEWPWMTALIAQTFQPDAPSDDPIWGFALVDREFRPRALAAGLANGMAAPVQPATFNFLRFYALLAALGLTAATAAWLGAVAGSRLPWAAGWVAIEARFRALPTAAQFALLALVALAFYYSPNTALNLALVVLIVLLFTLRLDYGLTVVVFTVPFYLLPKTLVGSLQFSMVELLTLACVAAWLVIQTHETEPGQRRRAANHAGEQSPDPDHAVRFATRHPVQKSCRLAFQLRSRDHPVCPCRALVGQDGG